MSDDEARTRRSGIHSDRPSQVTRVDPSGEATSPTSIHQSIRAGALIGRFVVLGRLGEGGMAIVVQAYDPELDRRVAIKVMRGDVFGERGSLGQARMHREAQALARVSHPNIVSCYEVGKVPGGIFIAMELVQGMNLRTWLKEQVRSWREIVRVFAQAGEGLAAAHAAGLVHRDFKPDNVLVGDDGRVRVVDFGLARPDLTSPPAEGEAGSASAGEDPTLTEAGARVGTPAYMAPEQQLGQPADARSDVFGFAVSLYEALYGRRPFPGANADEVRRRVILGDPLPPPREVRIPTWLSGLVRKGMSHEPGDRYPSMAELLAELTRDRGALRRRLAASAAFAVIAGLGVGWALTWAQPAEATCDDVDRRLVGAWDPERRAAVEAAMTASGATFAGATWERSAAALDAYAQAWRGEARALCEAERADGEADREGLERRQLCLERRRGELQALTEVLGDGSKESVEHALQAIARLQAPASCADPIALAADDVAPPAAEDLMAVTALRERLTRVRAGEWAGRYGAVLGESGAIVDDARAIGYAPLLADALLRRATLLARVGDYPAAEAALTESYAVAESADDTIVRAEAMILRVELIGALMARESEVAAWIPPAIALVERVRPESALAGRLWANIGLVDFAAGRYAEAEVHQRKALALVERILPAEDPERINALFQLGRTLSRREGKHAEAVTTLEAARALAERILGPEHPALVSIYLNVANVYGGSDTDKLIGYYKKSLALGERVLGPRHPQVASARANLANTQMYEGRVDEALANYRGAVDIYLETLGENHPTTAMNICNLADGLRQVGAYDESRAWYLRAEAAYERIYGGPYPSAAVAIGGLGDTYAAEGKWEVALPYYHRAATVAFAGPIEPTYVAFEVLRAEVIALLALNRGGDAIEAARRLLEHAADRPEFEVGAYRFLLAQALASAGQRDEAQVEAAAAITRMKAHPGTEAAIAEAEAWIAALGTSAKGRPPRPPSVPAPKPARPVINAALPDPPKIEVAKPVVEVEAQEPIAGP